MHSVSLMYITLSRHCVGCRILQVAGNRYIIYALSTSFDLNSLANYTSLTVRVAAAVIRVLFIEPFVRRNRQFLYDTKVHSYTIKSFTHRRMALADIEFVVCLRPSRRNMPKYL